MIEDNHRDMIEQCANCDKLTEWETGFITSLKDRKTLSFGQKNTLEKVFRTRVKGEVEDRRENFVFEYGIIDAIRTDNGMVTTIAGHQVGHGKTKKEAALFNAFLAEAWEDIASLPAKVLKKQEAKQEEVQTREPGDDTEQEF
jgi:hypothetical protein